MPSLRKRIPVRAVQSLETRSSPRKRKQDDLDEPAPLPRSKTNRASVEIPNTAAARAKGPKLNTAVEAAVLEETAAVKTTLHDQEAPIAPTKYKHRSTAPHIPEDSGIIDRVSAKADVSAEKKIKQTRKKKTTVVEDCENESGDAEEKKISPRKRKTQEEKDAEAMPLAARTTGLQMFVGAHVSMAKGVENAVANCTRIGGNSFALFLKSQKKWENPPLKIENRDAFLKACIEQQYDAASHVLPHGSYLVNLAQEEKDKASQAYDAFIDDLHRCEALGIKYYNFHPGAAGKSTKADAIGRIAKQLNRALAETETVVPVLENMAGSGSVIGARFGDLRDIIANILPEFKSRIGVCLDTCHSFAAGYDLRTPESFKKVLQEFDDVVGLSHLKALHLNDSKAPYDSKRDLHQNIGLGFLGLRAFHNVMNEARLQNMPLILETPCDVPDPSDPTGKKVIDDKRIWAREIKLLESLIDMDAESETFKRLEKELSDKGKPERIKMQKQFDEKVVKEKKKIDREREKGQKNLMEMMGKKKKKGDKSPVLSDEEEVSE